MHKLKKFDQKKIVNLLLQPPARERLFTCPKGAEDVILDRGRKAQICRFYFSNQEAPNILYFPDPNDSVDLFSTNAGFFQKYGMNVFFVLYGGAGKNSAAPSISSLLNDSVKFVPLVKQFLAGKCYSGPVFIMGRSFGSMCAVETAFNCGGDIKGMIIESGFCSLSSYISALGIDIQQFDINEKDGFDMLTKVENITVPTLIFHGAADSLIPVAEAEKIQSFSGARNKQFLLIPGGTHNNLAQIGGELFYKTIKEFANTVCGVNTWRRKRKKYRSAEKEQ